MQYKSSKSRSTKTTRLKAIQIVRSGHTLDLGPGTLSQHLEWKKVRGGDEIPGAPSWEVFVENGVPSSPIEKKGDPVHFSAASFSGRCLAADEDYLRGVGALVRAPRTVKKRRPA